VDWIWELRCTRCGTAFAVCRCCYTGQRYCNDDCRARGRADQLRQAQRQYALTDKGQQALARAAANYRATQRGKAAPGEDGVAPSRGGDDETDRAGVRVGARAGGAVEGALGGDAGWLAVVPAAWLPAPCAERTEPCATTRQLAVASWAETVHWLRFVIDQTLPGGGDREYLGVRRARCQLCGHEGPLVRPVLATNGVR